MVRNNRHAIQVTDLSEFPPTVVAHSTYKNGVRLHTMNRDPDEGPSTDIDIYFEDQE